MVPVPRRLSSSTSKPEVFSPPLRPKEMPGIERPHVLRRDLDVDDAIVEGDRADLRVAQVSSLAEDARRLLEQIGAVQITAVKQQLVFDRRNARLDVKAIAEAR